MDIEITVLVKTDFEASIILTAILDHRSFMGVSI